MCCRSAESTWKFGGPEGPPDTRRHYRISVVGRTFRSGVRLQVRRAPYVPVRFLPYIAESAIPITSSSDDAESNGA